MTPLISVILPAYNRAEQAEQAVLSVLNQTEADLELIVVDDGSTDDTASVLARISDPRLRCVRQEHGGACRARNLGVSLARGRYVAFQDSDDLWRPEKLRVQLRCLRETGADILFCQLARREADGSVSLYPSRLRAGFVLPEDPLLGAGTQTLIGVREAFLSCPFDPDMPRLQEFEMLCRLRKRYSLYYLDRPLVDYRPGGDSISASPEKLIRAIRLLREKHPALFSGPTAEKKALSGRLRLDARNACLSGQAGWEDCLRFAAELDGGEAKFLSGLARIGLYPPYIRLREALKKRRDGNTALWRVLAFPVRWARSIRQTMNALFHAEQLCRFRQKKRVFGSGLALQWAVSSAADILTGGRSRFYHRAVRRFLDGELAEAARAANALPEPAPEEGPLPVWALWWDGEESAPPCVKLALNSQRTYFSGPEYAYRLLTKANYAQYAPIDPIFLARYEKGEMCLPHLSDVLRCALLRRHGGLWIDATVYMTGPLDGDSLKRAFFTVRRAASGPNRRGLIPAGRWACYLLRCRPGDPLAVFLSMGYAAYWRKYAGAPDYYLLDEMIDAAYRLVPSVRRRIDGVPVNNERVFGLHDLRNEAYLPEKVEPILRANRVHKLSWRYPYRDACPDGRMTVWKWMREEARREV